jgi:hypothetical protein
VELRVLGPVELYVGDQVWEVGPPQRRHVLAALAVDAGRPVTTETLIDRVWDEAPDGARRALQVHLSNLRGLLERVSRQEDAPAGLARRSGDISWISTRPRWTCTGSGSSCCGPGPAPPPTPRR